MIVCRRDRRRTWLLAVVLSAAAVIAGDRWVVATDSPIGRTVAEIIVVNSGGSAGRIHPPEHVLGAMHSRAGKPYDEGLIQEDVRRLHATKWFAPGGVRVHAKIDPDGRVTVFVQVTELTSTVQDVQYIGAEHISPDKLKELAGVRKGEPMNPLSNEVGRQAILRQYQEDGRFLASVDLVEGGKPADARVVYSIVEGPVVKVAGVEFRGNTHAETGRLKTQLATKREFIGVFGGKFNPMSVDMDLKQLVEYYHRLGFLSVRITPEVVRTADPSHVRIVYHIVEGIQYRVGGTQFEGNKTFDAGALSPLTDLKAGERYDEGVVRADMQRVKYKYGIHGHNVAVDKQVYEDPDQPGTVRVHYVVQGDRGEPDRVGRVIIEGNTVTQDRVIMNQLGIYPGQVLQYPKLEDARMRLARLGIFDTNNPPEVLVEQNDLDSNFKDVLVRVGETRTGQVMIGGGINSNAGLTGNFVINERNFDICRFPTSWDDFRTGRAWRGAGQELRLEAQPGTQYQQYRATFREPYLFDTQFGFSDSVYYFQRQYIEYMENRIGDRITIDRRLDSIWKASVTTRIEEVEVKNVPVYAPPSISNFQGWNFLLGIRGGLTRDTRDSFIFPTKGNVFDIGFEQVLGKYTFPIGTAEFTQFFSSKYLQREDGSGKHVLAVRSQVGVEGANAPVYERFYAGGFRSLRGFTFRGVGPVENDLHTGGTFSFLNTVEYQVPILQNDRLFFVTFLDHGTVEQTVEIKNYRVSAGFGFRINVPALGPLPIALDFAFPLNQAPGDNKQLFSFYVGLFGG
ncbi:MAG: bamA [Gemmataceae bacterium]|nr:bamA [Gemmataceae bacterium]